MSAASNPFLATKPRPIVVGHRGVPKLHQENTLAGFRRAVELGIPAVELDVRLTADERAVVCHDSHLPRLTGSPASIAEMTWDQLSRQRIRREVPMGVDAFGTRTVGRYEREEPIPLLAEVLAEVGGKLAFNIELKLDYQRWWHVEVGPVVAKLIADAGIEDRVIVTSFDPRKLRAASRVRPHLPVGFCFDDTMLDFANRLLDSRRMLGRLLDSDLVGRALGTRVVGAEHTLVGESTVRRLHRRGVAVGTHTIFPIGSTTGKRIAPSAVTEAEVHRLVELGIDWIESDDPERLLEMIG
jgi:glycerophosphoryl diester phosphodiesterase